MTIKNRILEALRQNLVPGLILQCFALVLVLGYYYIPGITVLCLYIGEVKTEYGYLFSAISTSFFGGVIPFLILCMRKEIERAMVWKVGVFYTLFWLWKGVEIDFLYRMQAMLFGEGIDFYTILKKVIVDQLVYNPFYAVICIAVFHLWKDHHFSLSQTRRALNRHLFTQVIPTMMFCTWLIWFPTTAIVYSMPSPLQMPLFNMVLCFYVLLINVVGSKKRRSS